jgi:hypothetical protein
LNMSTPDEPKELPRWLRSSVDPNKYSLTIRGFGAAVPLIIVLAAFFGIDDLKPDTLLEAINQLAIVVTGSLGLWGAIRKVIIAVLTRKR